MENSNPLDGTIEILFKVGKAKYLYLIYLKIIGDLKFNYLINSKIMTGVSLIYKCLIQKL